MELNKNKIMYGDILYGDSLYADDLTLDNSNAYRPCEDVYLMKYFPEVIRKNSKNWEKLTSIIELYLCNKNKLAEELQFQGYVDTATWGLTLWEDIFALNIEEDDDLIARREIIRANLRGRGKTTKEVVINVAEAFSGGEVDIIEFPDEFYFILKFIGQKGIPKNLEVFKKQLDIIKPSHIGYKFEFILITYSMLNKDLEVTHEEPKSKNITYRMMKEYRVNEINDEEQGG